MVGRVKVPCCSVCHTRYNEDERVPLLLECGHGFCKDCLFKMFSTSSDTTLTCPRCRHVSIVGNSVQGLRKNYAMLALIPAASGGVNFFCDYTDVENEDGDEDGSDEDRARSARGFYASSSRNSSCGPVIVGAHPEMKLVRQIGEESSGGVEMWDATVAGGGGRCKRRVVVKKMTLTEEMDVDWMQGQLESLPRASMWCRNVCTFHGAVKMEGSLCLLMDKCYGSVQSEMQRNEGRLTLEQILRWDGLSREENFQAVVKARKVPPQYERIVGVGIPRELWKMIGECLQFKPSKRPTFNAMLATFLRHLQEVPRSLSASPDNGIPKLCEVKIVEATRATNMGVFQDNPNNLHRVVLEGDFEGVRNILAKAAARGGRRSVRSLLEAQNPDGQSALHLACRRGSAELVEAILEHGEANVDIVDKDGDVYLL